MSSAEPVSAAAGKADDAPASAQFEKEIKPLLSQYCYGCHGEAIRKADLSLQAYQDVRTARKDRKVWERVLQHVHAREMPPEGEPQPTEAERGVIAKWIATELFPLDCDHPDPGRVTIRRLNRVEYNNTIRDLVGVDFQPAEDFPADDSGYGFDNIGDVLSLSPLLLEKYLAAAEQVLDRAVVTGTSRRAPKRQFLADKFKITGGGSLEGCCVNLFSTGEISVDFPVSPAGDYIIRVGAYGQQAGPERAKMGVKLDGQELKTIEVKEEEAAPGTFELHTRLEPGTRHIAAAFLNDYYNPDDPNPANRDRNLVVQSIEIEGPLDAAPPPLTEAHRRIFICQPTPATRAECTRRILADFARRAYRRPVTTEEVERLARLAEQAQKSGERFESAIKVALEAVLISPHFLFRGELQPEPDNPRVTRPIDEFALASRLSYFLWSSMPDEELFALADKGRLRANLEPQVRRMVHDPKAHALVVNFAGQWLQLRNLDLVTPDPKEFPSFDADLRTAMRQETELLFEHILREDLSVLEFLTADYTFVNERLARHYGLSDIQGREFRRVSLAGKHRGGVLTHASVLTITSNPTRTSPVKRGKWVLENILNAPPPPPPPDVPPLNETKSAAGNASLRQRMEQHRENPLCASCHAQMDPIGFGMENFDGIGAWREKDGNFAIDASGKLVSGEPFDGAAQLRLLLATRRRDDFVRCLTEKMLTYALGRGLEYFDQCAVEQITRDLAKQDFRFPALVMEVVKSTPFQMRRGEGDRL